MVLSDIERTASLEGLTMEIKARLNRKDPEGWLKTVSGFANAQGGVFYLGVDDETGRLDGFTRKEADDERNYFNNQVNQLVYPRPFLRFSFLPYQAGAQERVVIKVQVPESESKPVLCKHKGLPVIYMRRDGFTNGATPEEIRLMSISSAASPFDLGRTSVRYDRADFTMLNGLFSKNNNGRELADKVLAAAGFFDQDGMLSQGALLFRDGYEGALTSMKLFVFPGLNRGASKPLSAEEFHGNILEAIQHACGFVARNMNRTFVKLADRRVDYDAYPARALFEGVVNAVAHRDYWIEGAHIQIDMYRDRLQISSPGNLYMGRGPMRTYELGRIISKRRNKLVSEILVRCKMMEAAGTGFDKILEEYAGADSRHRPFIMTGADHFTLVLPDLTYEPGVVDSDIPALEFIPPLRGSEYDKSILGFCFSGWKRISEIAAFLGVSDSSYLRKRIIANLKEAGLLEERKNGRICEYRTRADNVRKV